jgi:glycosyltransferase involved in cell wall biosynthesis
VLTQQNAGPSHARNTALRVARGAFIAFLDSDDEWMPTFLETQLAVLDRRPSTAVVTGNAINRGGRLDGVPYRPIQPAERVLPFVEMIEREDAVCVMSVFRRAVYEKTGGFDDSLCGNEDYDFWLRAAQSGFEFVQTFEPLAYYRRRQDSASANDQKMASGIIHVLGTTRARCGEDFERQAIDRQIARFERELLSIEGRDALHRRDFSSAVRSYEQLYEKRRTPALAALLFAVRHAPRTVLWMAGARRALRRVAAPSAGV